MLVWLKDWLGFTAEMTAVRHWRQTLGNCADAELTGSSASVFCANADKLNNMYTHTVNHASKLLLLSVIFFLPLRFPKPSTQVNMVI